MIVAQKKLITRIAISDQNWVGEMYPEKVNQRHKKDLF
jgi:hypothetical protein